MSMDDRPFRPDWYSPTGVTIKTCMASKGVSREHLSHALGESDNGYVDSLLDGSGVVGPESAKVLASVLGATAEFWIRRDDRYWADRRRIEAERGTDE
jgi:HTH-type transcriptional regulator / antitoxin HigA